MAGRWSDAHGVLMLKLGLMASIGCSPVSAGADVLSIKARVGQMHRNSKERPKKLESTLF
jgi:hypothetical protein